MAEIFELILYSNGSKEYTQKVLNCMRSYLKMPDLGFTQVLTKENLTFNEN